MDTKLIHNRPDQPSPLRAQPEYKPAGLSSLSSQVSRTTSVNAAWSFLGDGFIYGYIVQVFSHDTLMTALTDTAVKQRKARGQRILLPFASRLRRSSTTSAHQEPAAKQFSIRGRPPLVQRFVQVVYLVHQHRPQSWILVE